MENNNNFNQNFENQTPVEPVAPQNYVPQPEPVQAEPMYNGVPQGNVPPMPAESAKNGKNGLAIASLICGIASVVSAFLYIFCCCGCLNVPLGIAAIITGAMSKKQQKDNNAMALIGIILGAASIAIFVVVFVIALITGAALGFAEGFSDGLSSTYYY